MPKLSTPDSELKTEFASLREIAKREKANKAEAAKIRKDKHTLVSTLSRKKNANMGSMAAIFSVSRQALAKEVRAYEVSTGKATAPVKAEPKKDVAAKKAPAKKAAPAAKSTGPAKKVIKRPVRKSAAKS